MAARIVCRADSSHCQLSEDCAARHGFLVSPKNGGKLWHDGELGVVDNCVDELLALEIILVSCHSSLMADLLDNEVAFFETSHEQILDVVVGEIDVFVMNEGAELAMVNEDVDLLGGPG